MKDKSFQEKQIKLCELIRSSQIIDNNENLKARTHKIR